MKKVAKSILTGLCIVLILAGILVLLINVYLQSAAVQNQVQRSLGEAFEVPIEIRTISFTPPGGLKLSGIAVPSDVEGAPEFLRAVSVTVRFRLSPLFRKRFVIQEIAVHGPDIHWMQSSRGKWQPPAEAPRTAQVPTPAPTPVPPAPTTPPEIPTGTPPPRPSIAPTPPASEPPGPRFEVHVQHFSIKDGEVRLRDRDGDPLADFSAINISSSWSSKNVAIGKARAKETRIGDQVLLRKLSTDFKCSAAHLSLRNIDATVGDGNLSGKFDADLDDPQMQFKLHAAFEGVKLSKLVEESGTREAKISGKLSGKLQLQGGMRDRNAARGQGHISIEGGSFRQYGILQMIGEQLRIRELTELELEQATANFRIDDGKIHVDDLILKSPNLKIQIKGIVKLDGHLKLDARLTINNTISRQLPRFIEENFMRLEDSEFRYVDFDIGGTIDDPDTELMRAILWKKHEEAAKQIFRQIFGK